MATCIFVKNKNNDWKKKDKSASAFLDFNMEILQSSLQIAQAVGGVSHFLVCLQITDSPPLPQALDDFLNEWFIVVTVSPPLALPKHTISKQNHSNGHTWGCI